MIRREWFASIGSTNDVVREWLAAGSPEICLAVADVQTAGRGRRGRTWEAPPGAALLLSLGFRPTWLVPDRVWRLAATTSLAMADAAEEVAGLADGTLRLKWPNDLVVEVGAVGADSHGEDTPAPAGGLHKVGGVLGESDGLGTTDPRVVVGIGVNVDWAASDFPPDLRERMSSLREVSRGRPVDRDELLERFVDRLEVRIEALRTGYFDVAGWVERQATTGRQVSLEGVDGVPEVVRALGVDALSGALIVEDANAPDGEGRSIHAGEIAGVRLVPTAVEV